MPTPAKNGRLPNYLRIHRRKIGLSQRELSEVLGCTSPESICKHEWTRSMPPLKVAIAYEIVYRIPISELFGGIRDEIAKGIQERLRRLEKDLGNHSVKERNAAETARKLMWLSERKNKRK